MGVLDNWDEVLLKITGNWLCVSGGNRLSVETR